MGVHDVGAGRQRDGIGSGRLVVIVPDDGSGGFNLIRPDQFERETVPGPVGARIGDGAIIQAVIRKDSRQGRRVVGIGDILEIDVALHAVPALGRVGGHLRRTRERDIAA